MRVSATHGLKICKDISCLRHFNGMLFKIEVYSSISGIVGIWV